MVADDLVMQEVRATEVINFISEVVVTDRFHCSLLRIFRFQQQKGLGFCQNFCSPTIPSLVLCPCSIDATAESGKLGRLLNHSRHGNCCTKVVNINNHPHLILVAAKDIESGVELLYDYGDRSKEALEAHPWLAL